MKTFCAIFLVGIVAYVQVQGVIHDCDPFAVNLKLDNPVQRKGHDADNEEFELSKFLARTKVAFYVTHASPTTVKGSNEFCTAPTHGTECAGVEYARFLNGNYQADRPEGVEGIQFKTTFIGWDQKDEMAIEYNMTIVGINKDDFIFQWVKDTEITAHLLDSTDSTKRTKMDIEPKVLEILQAPFALYSIRETGHALYVTCDGKYGWVAFPQAITNPSFEDVETAIEKLIKVAANYKKEKLVIGTINKEMPEQFHNKITALVKA